MDGIQTKGQKQVTDEQFYEICALFDRYSRTTAVKLARPIIKNRADQTIYQRGRDMGLTTGQLLKAIVVDGFSIVCTTPCSDKEVDAWIATRPKWKASGSQNPQRAAN